ncbi:MAG: ParB/RepB/Spo0J family partition protein [Anaerolineales bacterium]|nr:ParB/RepB/Spo0J family partition protein [Anaerolineales bacterium]
MSSRRPGLGKGLDALIPQSSPADKPAGEGGVMLVGIDTITPNPHQPRTKFEADALQDLAASIKEHGVIQPLIVTKGDQPSKYFLIAGERRWQAAKLAGMEKIPAILREATQQEMLLLALIENVQRADLNPLETAQAYRELAEKFDLTHNQIADRVGKSRPSISNTLKLLEAAPDVLQALLDGEISEGHARAVQGLLPQVQNAAVSVIKQYHLSVRQAEELSRNVREFPESEQIRAVRDGIKKLLFLEHRPESEKKHRKPKAVLPPVQKSPELLALEEQLTQAMEFKTTIRQTARGGMISIEYYNQEDLNTLTDKLLKK